MKKSTMTDQSAKVEIVKTEVQNCAPVNSSKMYRNHKSFDHGHGRVNKHCIGVNHEPGLF